MSKVLKIILVVLVGVALLLGGFSGGFVVGHNFSAFMPNTETPIVSAPSVSPTQQAATPQNLQTLFKPFWEAWQIIHADYVDQPLDDTKLMQGAISGMMQSLGDPHSTYMDPETYKEANQQLAGSYEGIGAYVDTSGDYLTVTSPIPGSPADKAGILPGDQIVAIDHQDMTGISPEIVRQKVLGPAGTVVHLTIRRKGESALIEIDITRAKIDIPSATGKMLDGGIAYIQVTTFGDNTTKELTDTLNTLMPQHPKGIILDLRNNGGGYLQTAVEVVSQFQGNGVVLYEKYGDGTKKSYDVIPGGMATDTKIPMVVLINEGSASASEITAGALHDYGRAKLVGVVSYGKGSVQNWIPLSDNQGAVRVTIAHWLTPNGTLIDKKGLTPDVYVPMTADDRKAGRDPQLDAAVTVIQAMLNNSPLPTSVPTPTATPAP